jgi:hypothetical protein
MNTVVDARQHGCDRQGVDDAEKPHARMRAHRFKPLADGNVPLIGDVVRNLISGGASYENTQNPIS